MGIISRLFGSPKEKRSSHGVDDPQYWTSFFSQFSRSRSGQSVSPDSAMQSAAVFACVRVLAETIASLPLITYKRKKSGGKDVADGHANYYLLHDSPNDYQTSFEYREMCMGHAALRGNAFCFKLINQDGQIGQLIPLNPARMTVITPFSVPGIKTLTYRYTWADGTQQDIEPKDIWHWKGLSSDGYVGLSPITLMREAVGLTLAAEDHGATFFGNKAMPGGILSHPGKLSEPARDNLRDSWQRAHSGERKHTVAVLEEGLKWESIAMSNEDSQFLETRQFQVEEIARIFRVPSVLIGHSDATSTYASAEQFFLNFVVYTILPWTVRIEQSANKSLFTDRERRQGYFVEFKLQGLLRGDSSARSQFYMSAINNGWMTRNEVRELENLNPDDRLDDFLQPLNMVPVGEQPPPQKGSNGGDNGSQTDEK